VFVLLCFASKELSGLKFLAFFFVLFSPVSTPEPDIGMSEKDAHQFFQQLMAAVVSSQVFYTCFLLCRLADAFIQSDLQVRLRTICLRTYVTFS